MEMRCKGHGRCPAMTFLPTDFKNAPLVTIDCVRLQLIACGFLSHSHKISKKRGGKFWESVKQTSSANMDLA